jgi:anti-sigma factor RsiW
MNTKMDCKTFQNELPDLVLTANAKPSLVAVAHLRECPPCAEEYLSFQSTFAALDAWTAPEPSPYFDQKLAVRIREEQTAPKMNWLQSLQTRLLFNTGRNFRPALIGALGLALVVSGGGIAGINGYQPWNAPAVPQTSAAVNDLQILDRNEQAFQQLDELQQEDVAAPQDTNDGNRNDAPAPDAPPAT